ncbi:host-nuclease inhibitor Gam family protein [Patescibacteria group bacterium]|nr:host-nuclease inhibitor Gam family protein [Patescibacteria group bacterium]
MIAIPETDGVLFLWEVFMAKNGSKPGVRRIRDKFPVPQTLEQASLLIALIGEKRRKALAICEEADAKIAKIQKAAEKRLGPLTGDLDKIFPALKAYAEAHRSELTANGKTKTVTTATGKMFWRDNPPSVKIPEDKIAELILHLESDPDLAKFLRQPPKEINKDALKEALTTDDLETVKALPNVEIVQGESFRVKPKDDTTDFTQDSIKKILKKAS